MSANGPKRTRAGALYMSAFSGKADIVNMAECTLGHIERKTYSKMKAAAFIEAVSAVIASLANAIDKILKLIVKTVAVATSFHDESSSRAAESHHIDASS